MLNKLAKLSTFVLFLSLNELMKSRRCSSMYAMYKLIKKQKGKKNKINCKYVNSILMGIQIRIMCVCSYEYLDISILFDYF